MLQHPSFEESRHDRSRWVTGRVRKLGCSGAGGPLGLRALGDVIGPKP